MSLRYQQDFDRSDSLIQKPDSDLATSFQLYNNNNKKELSQKHLVLFSFKTIFPYSY